MIPKFRAYSVEENMMYYPDEDPKTEEAFYSLSRVEEAEVIQMFIEWFLEQEKVEWIN